MNPSQNENQNQENIELLTESSTTTNQSATPTTQGQTPVMGQVVPPVAQQPVVEKSVSTPVTPTVHSGNANGAVNGGNNQTPPPMREVTIQNKPPGKFRYFMLIVLFVGLIAMVWFLPEISSYLSVLKSERENPKEEITSGVLRCELMRSTDNFDYEYSSAFSFTDKKLYKLVYKTETRGSAMSDEDTLSELNTKCETLSSSAKQLDGVSVSCEFSSGSVRESQTFSYRELNMEKVTAAYTEAGGVYPEFELDQDIDMIERNMKASGYTCERSK